MINMLNDNREIVGIYWNDEHGTSYQVGSCDCTGIKAYAEGGMHCDIPFIAVYKGDYVITRVPAWQVQIVYKEPAK